MATKRPKAKTKRTPRTLLMPGEFKTGPIIVVAPLKITEGGSLRGHIKYTLTTTRHDADWQIEIEWIGKEMESHLVSLPSPVCLAIYRQRETIIKQSLKARGRKSFETAKHNARQREGAQE